MAFCLALHIMPAQSTSSVRARARLGGVSNELPRIIYSERWHVPRGSQVVMRGKDRLWRTSYVGRSRGWLFAIILVYQAVC